MRKNKIIFNRALNPYFSIITVVKNDQNNIEKTIESIKHQSFSDYEYIIIDGKSIDKTVEKILKYKKFINLLISEKDNGIYYAMNKGIKLAKGNIIVFVNSGDLLKKNSLQNVSKIFLKDKKIDYVFGTVKRHYTTSTILKYGVNTKRLKFNFDFATAHSTGFFLKKEIFKKYGSFNTKFKLSADYDLYYRIIITQKLSGGSTSKNKLIGEVTKGGYSSKVSFIQHLIEETKIRIHNKQNLLLVFIIFVNALIKFLIKKII